MIRRILLFVNLILILASMWIALTIGQIRGPQANPDSVVRNIIYAHVPSSICAMLCFVVLLVASIGYLITSKRTWDLLAMASAEVGTVFAAILNLTGSIFSRAEWGMWWTPSPRLVSAALLWFLCVVYLILRSSIAGSADKKARICAVYGIIAFLDVPMVYISARYMQDIHQPSFSFDAAGQRLAFFMSMASIVLLGALLIWIRTDLLKIKNRLEEHF
ncbi:MAG: cytochrome c biogenesis protein [Phycisphaerae bacterium]|nr:cytochrome c biogenesis protein [Phycisphaerae bacterium]